jgi:hypothetical protein
LQGSTPHGDAARGQAQFLRGMAWYELGEARARAIDADTIAAWNRSVQAGYNQYLLERARRSADRKAKRDARLQEVEKTLAQTQRRWREHPTVDDVRSGLALNALASDLADPSIPASSWREARVELPAGLSIDSLVFRFAAAPRHRPPAGVAPAVVAVGRMQVNGKWPVSLRRPELERQRLAYERSVKSVLTRCEQGQTLQAADVDAVRDALAALKDRASEVLPAGGGQGKQAAAFLGGLDEATRIFLDQDFAEELIRDVARHRAKTVEELLGFMRKYRLLFAEADQDPGAWQAYQTLYELLRRQKTALDFAGAAEEAAGEKGAAEEQR